MAVEKSREPEARMERRKGNAVIFQSSYNASILGNPTYRSIFSYRMHHFYGTPPYQQQFLEKSRRYIRMFCAGLLGFVLVLLLCLSPLHWVQLSVLEDRKKLLVGLWTVCHHNLCWSHTPKAPYYLQFSRAFFLISALIILIIIIWLSISFTKWPGHKTYTDLGMSIFCFISGTCLLLCLILFLIEVKSYSRNVLEPRFLLVYRLNCLGSVLYMIAGFLSGLNHISSRVSLPDQNHLVIPRTRARIGPMTTLGFSITETNACVSPRMYQTPKVHSRPVAQPRTQSEGETQTEPHIGNKSVIKNGLVTQVRLATEIEPSGTIKPEPEAETTIVNVASDKSSSRLEGNEEKMTKDKGGKDRDSAEKNDNDRTKI